MNKVLKIGQKYDGGRQSIILEDILSYSSIVYSAKTFAGHMFYGSSTNFSVVP